MSEDVVISIKEVSEILNRSPKTIWRWWAKDKCMPPPLKVRGRSIGWKRSTIDRFLSDMSSGSDSYFD